MVVGNAFSQTDTLTVDVSNGVVVTLMVRSVSQPLVVDATVSINEPAALNKWPSIVVGNAFSQRDTFTVEVSNGVVVTLIVLTVSQPLVVLATVSIREPAALNK